ncbi:MAG: hypothetical protein ACOZQL_41325 [Myxococcota bacterium]
MLRHLTLLVSFVQLAACASLTNLLPAEVSTPAAAPVAAAQPPRDDRPPAPRVVVPSEGTVVRVSRKWKREDQFLEFELKEPVSGWTFQTHPVDREARFAVERLDAPAQTSPSFENVVKLELPAGRYRVLVRWHIAPQEPVTASLHPPQPSPLLHGEIPAELPLAERRLHLWFPFLKRSVSAEELFQAAPKSLFVFADEGMSGELNTGGSSSDWNTDAPKSNEARLVAGEPLLRLSDTQEYLATDLSVVLVGKGVLAQPRAGLAFPPEPRLQWNQLPTLVHEVDGPLKVEGERFLEDWSKWKSCTDGAARWLRLSTSNVVLTPQSRAKIDQQHQAMLKSCEGPKLRATEKALAPRLLEAWRTQRRARAEQLQLAVKQKLSAP